MRIAVVTGSRADQGPLGPVQAALGGVWLPVRPPKPQNAKATVMGCAAAMTNVCQQLAAVDPDMVVILGDRYEALAVATAAHLLGIPIAHLSGGDLTEGSQDDSMRHAITKLSHLHFATNALSATRIMQMGEEAWRVFTVGCPGIDAIMQAKLLTRSRTMAQLGVGTDYFLVAYQPATLATDPEKEAENLCTALAQFPQPCIFTTLNADTWGVQLERQFNRHCQTFGGVMLEMDHHLYLSAMKHCQVMVGNSSSGLYEAPTLKKAFVCVGDRQLGRLMANSVVTTDSAPDNIVTAIMAARELDCSETINLYGDGHAAERIADAISRLGNDREKLLNKKWASAWPKAEGVAATGQTLTHQIYDGCFSTKRMVN